MVGVTDARWKFQQLAESLYWSIASRKYGMFMSCTLPLADADRFFREGSQRCAEMRASNEIKESSQLLRDAMVGDDLDMGSGSTAFADGDLVAAAPDLLEACELAKHAMTNQQYLVPRIGMESEHAACVAVIAKAKGGAA